MTSETIRRCGGMVIAGAIAWAGGMLWAGPLADDELDRWELSGSLAWQIGILALLAVMAATRATGSGRFGRSLLAVGTTLVVLAMVWTVAHVVDPEMVDSGIMVALDAAWPLSMLVILVIAVVVAVVHRWTGRARWAPLISKLYVVAALVTLAVMPEWPGLVVRSLALATLFGWLGWVIVTDVASGRAVRDDGSVPPAVASPRREGAAHFDPSR